MWRVIPLASLVLLLPACGASSSPTVATTLGAASTTLGATANVTPSEKPDEFLKRLLDYTLKHQWGRTWDILHPGQQQRLNRERFIECSATDMPAAEIEAISTIVIYDDPLNATGVPETTAKAVIFRLTVHSRGRSESGKLTLRAVLHAGRWVWVLRSKDIAAYKAGNCPA